MKAGFIKVDNAECGSCGSVLLLEEFEINNTLLSKAGLPVDEVNVAYSGVLRCPKCNEIYPAIRKGIGWCRGGVTSDYSDMKYHEAEKANPFVEPLKEEIIGKARVMKRKLNSNIEIDYF